MTHNIPFCYSIANWHIFISKKKQERRVHANIIQVLPEH